MLRIFEKKIIQKFVPINGWMKELEDISSYKKQKDLYKHYWYCDAISFGLAYETSEINFNSVLCAVSL
jgi:hypothetical protein